MATLDVLKKSKKAERSSFTKAYNKLEELLRSETVELIDLEAELNVFKSKVSSLEVIHTSLLGLLPETEFEAEFEIIEDYRDKAIRLETKVQRSIQSKQYVSTVLPPAQSEFILNNSFENAVAKRRFKLPKLELRKFDGDVKEWLHFWSQFEKIHDDSSIENSDKFQYLLQATVEGSRAREVIESFPPTGDNYPKAVDCLKSRFGRNDLQVEIYVRELLKLVLKNSNSNFSSNNLSALYDNLEQHIRALETLGVTTDKSAALLYPLVESCMPEEFLRAWQRNFNSDLGGDSKKRLDSLLQFLKTEVESEERINLAMTGFHLEEDLSYKSRNKFKEAKIPTAANLFSAPDITVCVFCSGKHKSPNCFKAQKMSYNEKIEILKDKGYCFKCLKSVHRAKNCRFYVKCFTCNKLHYTIMCPNQSKNVNRFESNNTVKKSKKPDEAVNLASVSNEPKVLLQTLKVKLKGNNRILTARVLYDSGSQKSYIRKKLILDLGLRPLRQQHLSHALFGGQRIQDELHNVYKITLQNLDGHFSCNFDAFDQEVICNDVPSVYNGPWTKELKSLNIQICDIKESSGPIDILIGADVAGRLFTGKRRVLSSGLVAIESYLGWTIMGKTNLPPERNDSALTTISMFVREATISDLFSLELLGIKDPTEVKSREEKENLTKFYFEETLRINEEGRYEVSLPWKEDHLPLPSNKEIASKRLETITKKLHNENLFVSYDNVFQEWVSLGIIEDDPIESCVNEHYLPHRPVIKQKGTTKVRPVFDASARQVGTPSLNQCLESGPNLLELIPSLLLRFREHKYGIVADIEKAFLQISVRPEDRNYLKFLWWKGEENVDQKIMRHTRVVFGVKSSPFLLEAVLEHHLRRYLKNSRYNQKTVVTLLRSFYVDDLVTSLNDKTEISPFIVESHHILAEGKFNLRGWKHTGDDDPEEITSVLGLMWDRKQDELKINLEWLETYTIDTVSKRVILSVTHKVFDPIGYFCPVLLIPKLMLQKMWKDNVPWDREVEDDIKREFLIWFAELRSLKNLALRRCFSPLANNDHKISIHTFCDASGFAYAAAVFIRIEDADEVRVNLLAAKSRVAPVKPISIPRLELLAATVGARLCKFVINALQWKDVEQHFWTDSTTVLTWIQRDGPWTIFVNNRVQEIKKLSDRASWNHIPGTQNPADFPSRGCSARQLSSSKWWEGPAWLRENKENWPSITPMVDEESVLKEKRKTNPNFKSLPIICSLNQIGEDGCNCKNNEENSNNGYDLSCYWYYFSSYDKILRMVAWMKRFIFNCRNPTSKIKGELSYEEIKQAELIIVKTIQAEYFASEVNRKKLASLTTFQDAEGILRVRTKITYRKDSEDFKNPIILPSRHPVVKRLIMTEHKRNSHAGLQMLLNILREHYWILHARKTVRSVLSRCVICLRHAKRNVTTPTASLPENRIKDASVFEIIGVDLAGPLHLKGQSKVWICIYTCAVFRAVHFELLSSLTTEAFLQSFRRFIARRGRPSIVYCDNGSNFTGASNYFKLVDWDQIARFSSIRRIQWFFNPPTASWWGGFWERLVGVMKQVLRRVLGKAFLSYEEMLTVLCDAESVINSRPLCHMSEKDSELVPLSPNSFLQDYRQIGVPDLDQVDEKVLNKRIKYRQQLITDIRKRFRSEYLGFLVQRNEHKKEVRKIQLGEVVLIGSDNSKCIDWPLGVIIELLPGKDGVTRVVRLRTSKGEILRPIQRVFPLEVSSSWLNDHQFQKESEYANIETSSETPSSYSKPVVYKTKSGRTVKNPLKLNL